MPHLGIKFTNLEKNYDSHYHGRMYKLEPVNAQCFAIYGADDWRYADGTDLKGRVVLPNGKEVEAEGPKNP